MNYITFRMITLAFWAAVLISTSPLYGKGIETTIASSSSTSPPDSYALLEDFKSTTDYSQLIGEHWADLKYREIFAVYSFLDRNPPTVAAVGSGRWSDPGVWSTGKVPGADSIVWIPEDTRIVFGARSMGRGPKLIRVDGTLALSPTTDTRLNVGTIVVTHNGIFEIGTEMQPVQPQVRAEIVFADRGARDLARDPIDISGGLIATGQLKLHGARKTGLVVPVTELRRGVTLIRLAKAAVGWRVGDRLLFPGVNKNSIEDEVVPIAALHADGQMVEIEYPLKFDHLGPKPALVPIGNLTRNVVLRSEVPGRNERRGHIMVVHQSGGTVIDSVRFEELGRTRADAVATRPSFDGQGNLVPGSDANTIGRYMLHFHNRMGAVRSTPPHVVSNSVFEGGPRHGLVNHGANVIAQGNVSFRIAGSHFFAENGAEIGEFRNNLAVRSLGSGEDLKSRMYTFDFGHGGHGFWMQGGGIDVIDNYAFGHAGAAFILFSRKMLEAGKYIRFDKQNLAQRVILELADDDTDFGINKIPSSLAIREVPFVASSNVAAASLSGFQIWYHKRSTRHHIYSTVKDSVFWSMRAEPLVVNYSHRVALQNISVFGGDPEDIRGILTNFETAHLRFENLEIRGFRVGIQIPYQGTTHIRGGIFANAYNFVIYSPIAWGRRIIIEKTNVQDADSPWTYRNNVHLNRKAFQSNRINASYLYYHNLFLSDLILLDGKQIFFPNQSPESIPFQGHGPEALQGLTAGEIWSRHGLAIGGALAGRDALPHPDTNGLVGSKRQQFPQAKPLFNKAGTKAMLLLGYRLPEGRIGNLDLDGLSEGWKLVPVPGDPQRRKLLVMVDHTPPSLEFDENFPSSICPSDLAYGFLVAGRLIDKIGDKVADTKFRHILYDYETRDDSTVTYKLEIQDVTGNVRPVTFTLSIDPNAACRGPNIDHYLQVSDVRALSR